MKYAVTFCLVILCGCQSFYQANNNEKNEVTERLPSSIAPLFISAIVKSESSDSGYEVWLNPLSTWKKERRLADSYTSTETKEVDRITKLLSLCNLSEGSFEPCRKGPTAQQMSEALVRVGVKYDQSFQDWADRGGRF